MQGFSSHVEANQVNCCQAAIQSHIAYSSQQEAHCFFFYWQDCFEQDGSITARMQGFFYCHLVTEEGSSYCCSIYYFHPEEVHSNGNLCYYRHTFYQWWHDPTEEVSSIGFVEDSSCLLH
jgi:hypothetical protein